MCKIHPQILAATVLLAMSSSPQAQQTCQAYIREATPSSRFTINTDGTVLDTKTGLTWKRCAEGFSFDGINCTAIPKQALAFKWQDALNLAQFGWRLPSLKELETLVEIKCYNPATNLNIFPDRPDPGNMLSTWYWSSSPYLNYPLSSNNSWFINFYDGSHGPYGRNNFLRVRLVRDGQ